MARRSLTAILFTDIVDSTRRAAELGDQEWRKLLEAHHVRQALWRLDLSQVDVLFIENVGNLICPVGFDLGQDVKVGVFSVCGGDDKAAKHPYLVHEASRLLLKIGRAHV